MGHIDHLFSLDAPAMAVLLPMGLTILPTGHIGHVGPTIDKIRPDTPLSGQRFLEVFSLERPRRKISNYNELKALAGSKLRLQFRQGAGIAMKGVIVSQPGGDGLLLNLSFGFQMIDAVREYQLSNGDFSQTDLAIEMLYLVEAKNALMDESRKLNSRLQEARNIAEERALTDVLTGLKNRRALNQELQKLAVNGDSFSLMHVDLDHFKAVNDGYGHAAGDHVLQAAASVLSGVARKGDTVARVGGDEFVLVFKNLIEDSDLTNIADRIVNRLEIPVLFEGKSCEISGSIGVTKSSFYKTPDLEKMLADADIALYASKHKGRACATIVTRELLRENAAGERVQNSSDTAA